MTIIIDHITMPAYDHQEAARFLARIMGVEYAGPDRHFAPVPLNPTFKIAFYHADQFQPYHVGFHIGEEVFDLILANLQAIGWSYGNHPQEPGNLRTDHPFGGRGLYFIDPNGHLFEVMTKRDVD